jgi:dihydrofolate synthase/folylpolyglutamate synthase
MIEPPPIMTYPEALAWWYSHVNYESAVPARPDDLKLERMKALLRLLGEPHRALRIVHIAGSKGKGSTAAMLECVLRRAGYRTGLFTSPHLCRVEERFEVDGEPISATELAVLLSDVRAALSRPGPLTGTPPTFFELATAVGFLHFVRRRVEAAVLEVGLGGRLDCTNVCLPSVAVITSISFDHTRLLGDRLASIAREKAGIVKPGRPVVSGATAPEARLAIEEVCRARRAPLRQLEVDFRYRYHPGKVSEAGVERPQVEVQTWQRHWLAAELNLLGEHQAANAAVAVAVVEVLREQGWHLPDAAVRAGLGEVVWPARMEVVGHRPLVVLDCAHNVASALALVETLDRSFPPGQRLLVFAGSGDKDVAGMFRVLAPHFRRAFFTRFTSNARAVPPEQLAAWWHSAGGAQAEVCATPADGWTAARTAAQADELICITGSVFLAGEVRSLLGPA